jgi:hypothetical protein
MGEADEAGAPYDVRPARVDVIHLDTSFLIKSLVRGSAEDRSLRDWLKAGEAVSSTGSSRCPFCGFEGRPFRE